MPRKTAKPLESQTSLRLPSETLAHLQKLADAEGLKVADLIRRAIAQVFPKK
jgi:predicted DNA-binding protein